MDLYWARPFEQPVNETDSSIYSFQAETSLMTFEGQQMQGTAKIMEKIGSLTFQKIAHLVRHSWLIVFNFLQALMLA